MWVKAQGKLAWFNLDAMAEVTLSADAWGTWQLTVREPGSTVAKVLLADLTGEAAQSVLRQLERFLTPIDAEGLQR